MAAVWVFGGHTTESAGGGAEMELLEVAEGIQEFLHFQAQPEARYIQAKSCKNQTIGLLKRGENAAICISSERWKSGDAT